MGDVPTLDLPSPHHPSCCMQVAVHAMQAALNATATSALAMRLTKEALHRSANEETDELISVLSQVGGRRLCLCGSWAKCGSARGRSRWGESCGTRLSVCRARWGGVRES